MSTCLASLTREILIHGSAVNKLFNIFPKKFQSTSGPFGQLRFTSLKCYSQRFSTYKYHTSHQTWSTMISSFPGRDSYNLNSTPQQIPAHERADKSFLTDTRCPFPSIGHFSFLSFLPQLFFNLFIGANWSKPTTTSDCLVLSLSCYVRQLF